ncbi:sensor histidine kinase [Maribellus maritimus]|uniref:sensor histidine kinase n=1 Tax=Maribellus maritimus TaxID=2870838 RepID=UPI001EEC92E6|nr:HAMP domain-containing sensor histidine kinase [Maribellus maritimus]MCG6186564.1 HAMP domain-containing histidine kinase [Maribellus maritimus]
MHHSIIQILTFFNSGITLIMGFYMLVLRRTAASQGTVYWALGSFVIGIGLLFRLLPPQNGYLSMVAPGIIVTAGLYLYLCGIWKFKKQKLYKWIIIGIPVTDFVQSLFFFFVFHSFRIQLIIHAVFLIFYCVLAFAAMLRLSAEQKYLKRIFQINAFSFFIFLFVILLNVIVVLTSPDFKPSTISQSGIALHIISGLLMIALTFGFLTAVNMRLDKDLRDQLKSKTKFFSIIAHDLRGPVGNIMNVLELLENESELDEKERKRFMETLRTLSQSTFHLLQNLLEWASRSSNLSNYETEILDVNRIVNENLELFKSSALMKSIGLDFVPGRNVFTSGNANMLQTIIRNLVSNAVKFTPVGGKVSIVTTNEAGKVGFQITDSGEGMDPKTLQSLLEFGEGKSKRGTNGEVGAGLGLVLCKEFISLNRGTLSFQSELGKGTRVNVSFPKA